MEIGITVKPTSNISVWILASSANVPGANGSYWTTFLSVGNSDVKTANVQLRFMGHDTDGTNGATFNQSIAAKAEYTSNDILKDAFGVTNNYGGIRITADTPLLNVTSQTSTPLAAGGSVGQSVPGIPLSAFINYGTPKSLTSLRDDANFRTNLILANAGLNPIAVNADLYTNTGTFIKSKVWTVPAYGMIQVNRLITDMSGTTMTNAMAILSAITPGGSFASYAVVVDNVTNDPRTILPQ